MSETASGETKKELVAPVIDMWSRSPLDQVAINALINYGGIEPVYCEPEDLPDNATSIESALREKEIKDICRDVTQTPVSHHRLTSRLHRPSTRRPQNPPDIF